MKAEERARTIFGQWRGKWHENERDGHTSLIESIAQALRDERKAALEEAAKAAINCTGWHDTVVAIRALKDTPEETK